MGAPTSSLSIQLRMKPAICDLVRPFYRQLEDHTRVFKHPKLRGVAKEIYFLRHRVHEDAVYKTSSKQNSHEAHFFVKLAEYFVFMQGYKPSEITILTPYLGQKRVIKVMLQGAAYP